MENLKTRLKVNKLITILGYAHEMDKNRYNPFFPYSRIRSNIRQFVEEINDHTNDYGFIMGRDLAGVFAFFNFYAHIYGIKRCFIAPAGAPMHTSQSRNVGTFFKRFEVKNISWCMGINNSELIPQFKITSDNKMIETSFPYEKINENVKWGAECPFLIAQSDGCIFFGGGKIAMQEEIPLVIKKAKENPFYKIIIVKGCGGVSNSKIKVLEDLKKDHHSQVYYAKNGEEAAQYLLKYIDKENVWI